MPEKADSISKLVQYVGRYYVSCVNREYGRTGSLWEGRYKGSLIDSDEYLLACQRYIELNPVRAGMVETPGDYPWSSYRAIAFGEKDPLLTPHLLYQRLGADPGHFDGAVGGNVVLPAEFGLGATPGSKRGGDLAGGDGLLKWLGKLHGIQVGFS